MSPDHRQPKTALLPLGKQVRSAFDPESAETQTIAWHFHQLDWHHDRWGFGKLKPPHWTRLLRSLVSLEGLTWAKLKEQCGGRGGGGGTNHHSLALDELCKDARDRLLELKLDECDVIFSLRLTNTLRIYGIREGRVLSLVWYDPNHGGKHAVYLTKNA
jgi:hypothetical protein